jgi:hypothetical protein
VGDFLFLSCDLHNYMGAAMNETFLLYLFTRLDSLNGILAFLGVCITLATAASLAVACFLLANDEKYPTFFHKLWLACSAVLLLNIVVPTQKDVAIILAGSTIMSLAKTDDAKRITSKSVQVVEQYLDAFLKKEKK